MKLNNRLSVLWSINYNATPKYMTVLYIIKLKMGYFEIELLF